MMDVDMFCLLLKMFCVYMSFGATSLKCFDVFIVVFGNDVFIILSMVFDIVCMVFFLVFDVKLRLVSGFGSFVVLFLVVMFIIFFSDVFNDFRGALINKNVFMVMSKW